MSTSDESARKAQEDADWQRIVESYGERPEFPDLGAAPEPDPVVDAGPVIEVPAELAESAWLDDDRFVPPPAPPVPRPRGVRGLAWFGLFGVPVLVLVSIILKISLPTPVPFLLLVWFVGGFGYLVATMSRSDTDSGWDDGAVL